MQSDNSHYSGNYPLVSIIVITYNSAKFVLETLESAKTQTYENIELIVSDDGSTDETIAICKEWIEKNKSRFVNTELIRVPQNTGIPANCNRGIKAANGEWVKLIAGDDCLIENCVEINVSYVKLNIDVCILQTDLVTYADEFTIEKYLFETNNSNNDFFSKVINAKEQHRMLLKSNKINAPSIFILKDVLIRNGLFDEELRLIEDWPMWIKITRANLKIYYHRALTVKYRRTSDSVMFNGTPYMNTNFARCLVIFAKKYIKHSFYYHYLKFIIGLKLIILLNSLDLNNKSKLNSFLYKLIYYLFIPIN